MRIDMDTKITIAKVKKLVELFEDWSSLGNGIVTNVIRKTVQNGHFPKEDVEFAINHYRDSIKVDELLNWVHNTELAKHASTLQSKKMICLLAGNLPMVGFQDVIVGLLSGVKLYVKISRKDPFLITSFLDFINEASVYKPVMYSTDLRDFTKIQANYVFFSGSESSVHEVKNVLKSLGCVTDNTRYLIRTAHFSVCIFNETPEDADLINLAESIWRYNGKGCRTVAVIFTKGKPSDFLSRLKILTAGKDLTFPSHPTNPALIVRHSLNVATNRPSILFNNKVIEYGPPEPHLENVVFVSPYQQQEFESFIEQYKAAIQSVYGTNGVDKTENLKFAQRPPISWQPDKVDPIRWLITNG